LIATAGKGDDLAFMIDNGMRRREVITLISGAAVAWPIAGLAQDSRKRSLIGYLTGATQPPNSYSDIFLFAIRTGGVAAVVRGFAGKPTRALHTLVQTRRSD
jgi:hypothetical protein